MKGAALRFLIIFAAIAVGIFYFGHQPRAQEPVKATLKNMEPLKPTAEDLASVPKVEKSDAEWKKQLTPEQYSILRGHSTERACSSVLLTEHRRGVFHCAGCNAPLFASDAKFVDFNEVPHGPWSKLGDNNTFVQNARKAETTLVEGPKPNGETIRP